MKETVHDVTYLCHTCTSELKINTQLPRLVTSPKSPNRF